MPTPKAPYPRGHRLIVPCVNLAGWEIEIIDHDSIEGVRVYRARQPGKAGLFHVAEHALAESASAPCNFPDRDILGT